MRQNFEQYFFLPGLLCLVLAITSLKTEFECAER